MKSLRPFLLFTFLFFQSLTFGNESILQAANDAYQAGQFKEAIEQYERLLPTEEQSADVHYNLGNSYFRMNQLGPAVLHFEKAALLKPRDKDILHNLRVAQTKVKTELEEIPEFFVTRWWSNTQKVMSPLGWGVFGLLLLWIGLAGLILWFRGGNRKQRKQGFVLGIILIILSILPFSLGFSLCKKMNDSGRSVVMTTVDLKSAPDEVSESIIKLYEGTTIRLLDQIGGWQKIRLIDGEEGWLEEKVMEKI